MGSDAHYLEGAPVHRMSGSGRATFTRRGIPLIPSNRAASPQNPRGGLDDQSCDPCQLEIYIPRQVKGLCASELLPSLSPGSASPVAH
jgi:hypothetical protein